MKERFMHMFQKFDQQAKAADHVEALARISVPREEGRSKKIVIFDVNDLFSLSTHHYVSA